MEQNFLKIHSYEAWIIQQEQTDTKEELNQKNETETSNNTSACNIESESYSLSNNNIEKRKSNELEENGLVKKKKLESNNEKNEGLEIFEMKNSFDTKSEVQINQCQPEKEENKNLNKSVFDPECFECQNR